jgi:hypothetical protein
MTMNRIIQALLLASFVAFTTADSAIAQPPLPCVTGGAVTTTPIAVTTYHYDNLRTGWNCNETILTPGFVSNRVVSSVNNGFGLLSTTTLDEQVNAQPLFVPKQAITAGANPGTYDVVYVATEANSVYAIDASTGNVLLQKNLGPPILHNNLPVAGCGNSSNSVGINSTPVIDLANHAMYLIVYRQLSLINTTPQYYLRELDLGSLTDLAPPLLVFAQHSLDNGTQVQFNAGSEQQRPALLFIPGLGASGKLYAGFGSFCDGGNASRGWLLGWNTRPKPLQATPLGNSRSACEAGVLQVDATTAIQQERSTQLFIGRPVAVQGHMTRMAHCTPAISIA